MQERPWHKVWPEGVLKTLTYPEVPLFQLLKRSAVESPNKTAVIFYGNRITYRELDFLTDKFANALNSLGVKKGDKVALFLPNCPQFIISYYGALKAGAIVVPFNPRYKEHEIEYQLNNSEAETIVSLDIIHDPVQSVREKTCLRNVIVTSIMDYMPAIYRMFAPGRGIKIKTFPKTIKFRELVEKAKPKPPEVNVNAKEDVAVLLYTGGTTGVPKGTMLTHFNLVVNTIQSSSWAKMTSEDITLAVLPFFHSYGMTVCMNVPIYCSASTILLPRFSVEEVLEAIERYKPTHFPAVPTIYVALLNHPRIRDYNLRSIRYCVSGAAPLPIEVAEKFREITGALIVEGYGLTETSPVTHINPADDIKKVKFGSIGIPIADTDAKIVDLETGLKELPPKEVGELVIKGPQVMKGYWKMPEETEIALRGEWLYTGDIAYMDEDGYFYIVDRKKDMINVGGLKVWPRDVEEVLYQHPAVKLAAVIGIPDSYYGEVPKAFIVLKEDYEGKVTEEDLINYCKERLAKHKVPKVVEIRKELPLSIIGKILRKELKAEEMRKRGS